MKRKGLYFGERDEQNAQIIVRAGFADSESAAVRVALMQLANAVRNLGPLVRATTP